MSGSNWSKSAGSILRRKTGQSAYISMAHYTCPGGPNTLSGAVLLLETEINVPGKARFHS
jgi:hypothetical protein